MAVTIKFRAPYIFHRDGALQVHSPDEPCSRLSGSTLSNTGSVFESKWNEQGFNASHSKKLDFKSWIRLTAGEMYLLNVFSKVIMSLWNLLPGNFAKSCE